MRIRRPGPVSTTITVAFVLLLMSVPVLIWFGAPHSGGTAALAMFFALAAWPSGIMILRAMYKAGELSRDGNFTASDLDNVIVPSGISLPSSRRAAYVSELRGPVIVCQTHQEVAFLILAPGVWVCNSCGIGGNGDLPEADLFSLPVGACLTCGRVKPPEYE